MKKLFAFLTSIAVVTCLYSCGETSEPAENVTENTQETATVTEEQTTKEVTEEETEEVTEEITESETEKSADKVATADDMITPDEVGYEGMQAIYGDSLNDGVYNISVDSSSSMFKIADCILYVESGEMTADIIIDSQSYVWLFMGTAEEAATSDESEYVSYTENEQGQSVFTVPIEALDYVTDCASYSKKKEQWYARQLVFRADSLPLEAFADGNFNTAETLELSDGIYSIDVELEGGSGKATVNSPAKLTVKDGNAYAEITWSSNNYDYMIVDGEKYLPVSTEEFSVFEIPVSCFDFNMAVSADTTAMSTPHEIDYTLYFDSSTISQWED